MGIFDRFPYSSTHEMNLDYMLGKATEIAEDMQTLTAGMEQVQAGLSAISEKTEQATDAAAQAAQSASSIEGSVTAAEEAAKEAQMHNESAQTWANNALTYKADCQRAATEAAASSSSAAQAATAAAASEDTVAQYAQAANASAQSAANNNDSAHQYANQASASASNATFHSSNAQTAATNAQTAATNANTSATNASASADRAATLKTDVETLHRMCAAAVDQAAEQAVAAGNSAGQAAATKTEVENLVESLPEDFTDLNNTVNQLSDEIVGVKSTVNNKKNKDNIFFTPDNSEIYATGKFATVSDGQIVLNNASAYNVYKVYVDTDTKWIKCTRSMPSGTNPIYVQDGETPVNITGKDNKRIHLAPGYILYNYSSTNGYNGVEVQRYNSDFPNVCNSGNYNANGLMQNGSITANDDYINFKITNLRYFYYEDTFLPIAGSCFNADDSYLGDLATGKDANNNTVFIYPDGTTYFVINQNLYDTKYDLKYVNKTVQAGIVGHACRRYDFTGKTITLLGDSIAYGFDGTEQSPYRWIALFCENNGCTCNNLAVGGARFARITDNSILNQMTASLDTDFIFIAAGTNDYGEGTPIGTVDSVSDQDLYGALNILCNYLKTNYPTKTVIFILPINRPGDVANAIPLSTYRNVIRQVAAKNKYQIIDGSLFGFPTVSGAYRNMVIPDGVHPNEAGYYMYDYAIENAIVK